MDREKIIWYFRRAKLMPPGELFWYRPRQKMQATWEKFLLKQHKIPQLKLSHKQIETKPGAFFIDLRKREKIKADLKETIPLTIRAAEKLMTKKISLFAFDDLQLDNPIDWHKDFSTGNEFPLLFGKIIDYRNSKKYGDVKYVWELNRHWHLVTLAKAYYITGNEKFRQETINQITNWIESNPYLVGINWSSALEVALRLINWCWVWYFLSAEEPLPAEFATEFNNATYQHCYFIRHNYSAYSSANNHLIGEATGLFLATALFDFIPQATKWNRWSRQVLEREIMKQITADGVNKEQATEYHCFTLDLFLLAYLLAQRLQHPFSKEYSSRLHAMFKFLAAIVTLPFGTILQIGDSDNARVLRLDESDYSPYLARLNCGAVLFQDPALKVTTGEMDETTYWLLGGGEINAQFQALPHSKPDNIPRLISFPEGGYFIFQTVNDEGMKAKLIFDCGTLGYPPLYAHGHSDALSIWLIIDGEEILTDAGTYAYHTEREWRDYFRSTAAHNTIVVQGENQSVIGGPFMWLRQANSKLAKIRQSQNGEVLFVAGSHNGYQRLSPPVIHSRAVNWFESKKKFTIRDELLVNGEIFIEELFHLAPGVEVELKNNNIVLLQKGKIFVTIKLAEILQVEVVKGVEQPHIKGWYSRVLGKKEPIYTITAWGRISTPVELITMIAFARKAEDAMRIILS